MATVLHEAGTRTDGAPAPAHRAPAGAVLHAQALGLHRARAGVHGGLQGDRGRAGGDPPGQGSQAHLRDQDDPHPGRRADHRQRRPQAAHRHPRAGDVELLVRQGARHAEHPPAGPVHRGRGAEAALPRAGLPLLAGQDGHRALAQARAGRDAGVRLRDRRDRRRDQDRVGPGRDRARLRRDPAAQGLGRGAPLGRGAAGGARPRRPGERGQGLLPPGRRHQHRGDGHPRASARRRGARAGQDVAAGARRRARAGSRRPATGSPRSRRAPSTRRCSSSGSRSSA